MGYTHYWGWCTQPADIKDFANKFKKASQMAKINVEKARLELVKRGKDPKKLELHWADGFGLPTFNAQEVVFNGPDNCNCESMWMNNITDRDAYEYHNGSFCWCPKFDKGGWFTKTDRLPYGYAVAVTLRTFAKVFKNDFKYWSDGHMTSGEDYSIDPDWEIAQEIVK